VSKAPSDAFNVLATACQTFSFLINTSRVDARTENINPALEGGERERVCRMKAANQEELKEISYRRLMSNEPLGIARFFDSKTFHFEAKRDAVNSFSTRQLSCYTEQFCQ
jgi:hypothetical protein